MSAFRTTLKSWSSDSKMGLNQPVLTLGSCFADTMGSQLKKFKFDILTNPFGVLFNPVSIHKALRLAITDTPADTEGIVQNLDLFHHYDFHSDLSASTTEVLQTKINSTLTECHHNLKKVNWVIITYGTAWIYTHNESKNIVANCHKVPASQFTKSLLSEKMITESFEELHSELLNINPDIKIILTVSPVRHLKDTLELNAVSKSVLRLACHTLSEMHAHVYYFPAYEIMVDDLRDYRFYAADMIHPSPVAENYIWDIFVSSFIDEKSQSFIQDWKQILKDLEHRPFHPEQAPHQQFLRKLAERISIQSKYVNVESELQYVTNQIINQVE
jgi:hypothetical protein